MEDQLFSLMREFNEKQELLNQLTRDPRLSQYTFTELHILKTISELESPNITLLSSVLGISKAALSKIIKRLGAQGLIVSYQLYQNRQKIYYALTREGRELLQLYKERDRGWKALNMEFLSGLSESERQNAQTYLRRYVDFLRRALERWEGREAMQ